MPAESSSPISLPQGVVFDCDGTLADTESLSYRAWARTLAERGYTMTHVDFVAVVGRPWPSTWAYFSERVDLGDPDRLRAQIRTRYLGAFDTELEIHDDAIVAMRELAARGVRIGVASSSMRSSVMSVLERAQVTDVVDVVIGADDVDEHKPAAEPYLEAVERLDAEPHACSAVEDTPVGIASAVAAGLFTVGILRAHNDAAQLAAAHRVVERISVDALVPDVAGAEGVGVPGRGTR